MPHIHPPTVSEHVAENIMRQISAQPEHVLAFAAMDDKDFEVNIEELLATMAAPHDESARKDGDALFYFLAKTRPYSITLTERQACKVVGVALTDMTDTEFAILLEADDDTKHTKLKEIIDRLSPLGDSLPGARDGR